MKHTASELIKLAYHFYPKGVVSSDPIYENTEENQRLLAEKRRATLELERFRALLDRLTARFPGSDMFEMLYLIPHGPDLWDACFQGELCLPTVPCDQGAHGITFMVSVLAPYYLMYSSLHFFVRGERYGRGKQFRRSWEISAVEQPYAHVIADEIEKTYGYELMPPEIGKTMVPVTDPEVDYTEAWTLFDYYFKREAWP